MNFPSLKRTFLKLSFCMLGIFGIQSLHAQTDKLNPLFEQGVSDIFQEKVFVDTDKSTYVTGETIWFKAYCVDATSHQLADASKVLYLELVDPLGQSWLQDKIRLQEGMGTGQFFLNAELPSGSYHLKAYTSWMKNGDPAFFFDKSLLLINPYSPPEYVQPPDDEKLRISFYPEGGNLITGLPSRVAVHIQDVAGDNLVATGMIQTDSGTVVSTFSSSERGMGLFEFTPKAGTDYRAAIVIEADTQIVALPKARPTGLVLKVQNQVEESVFRASIRSNSGTPQQVYWLLHTRGKVSMSGAIMADSESEFIIPKQDLPAGISHLTLFDAAQQPICERLLFVYPQADSKLKISIPKNTYGNREGIAVSVRSMVGDLVQASAAIYRYEAGPDPQDNSAVANLLLSADLKGPLPEPDYYLSSQSAERIQEMDLLMMTRGWRRFEWESVLQASAPPIQYPPELYAPILQGKIKLADGEGPPSRLYATFSSTSPEMYAVSVLPDGQFYLEVSPTTQRSQLLFWTDTTQWTDANIQLESPYSPAHALPGYSASRIHVGLRPYIEQQSLSAQLANAYLSLSHVRGEAPETVPEAIPFYGKPDISYLLDEYTRFPTMEEVFTEYIRYVIKKRDKGQRNLYVYDLYANLNSITSNQLLEEPALVMIDGIPLTDMEVLWNYDPLKVEKIEVVKRKYRAGEALFYGIINLSTYRGDFGGEELPPGMAQNLYLSLQQSRTFYAPEYDSEGKRESRIPDFRNLLLWEPNLQLTPNSEQTLKAFTADDGGTYRIEINGISKSGEAVYGTAEFTVETP